ncbi:MAG: VOC family protein [Myxococcota bacterium]
MSGPQLSVHLSYDGTCAEAFAFYASVFGGTPRIQTYGGSPIADQTPEIDRGRVMHAALSLGRQELMGADATSQMPFTGSTGFAVSVSWPSIDEARRVFDAIGKGGKTVMPFDRTFWTDGFGMVTDRFGILWMVSCDGHPADG